jgi:ubiquinone/menaquinone biosynthesis C-methylase UbiE
MTTDYNQIASEYKEAKQQPWREFVESFTLFNCLGDLSGKSVIDLACGEGYYTRRLKARGAARVLGVDLSEKMVELGEKEEKQRPIGVSYQVGDVKDLQVREPFDIACAAYLLNYASTREELLSMCQAIARVLKPGGRFVTVNSSPLHLPAHFGEVRKYGFSKTVVGKFGEGAPIIWKFFLDGREFEITNYQLGVETHEWAFRQAGLSNVRWHPAQLSPAGEKQDGREFWSDFLERSPICFIECTK